MVAFLMIIICIYIFFSFALTSYQMIFVVASVLMIIIPLMRHLRFRIEKEDFWWILCSLINVVGLIKTPNFHEALLFTGFTFCFIALKIVLTAFSSWRLTFYRCISIFPVIHIVLTIVQFFNSDIILKINQIILPPALLRANLYQLGAGKYAGITGQVGANAFYISIFVGIVTCLLIERWKTINRFKYILLISISFFALSLTTKRGPMLALILGMLIVFIIVQSVKLNKANQLFMYSGIILLTFIVVLILFMIVVNQSFWQHYIIEEDITSGRINIYAQLLEQIKQSPVIGNGLLSTTSYLDIQGHNIYLQILSELGIIGLFFYVMAFESTLAYSIKVYRWLSGIECKETAYVLIAIYVQVFFLLYGMTGNPLYNYFIFGLYMLFCAIPKSVKMRCGTNTGKRRRKKCIEKKLAQ